MLRTVAKKDVPIFSLCDIYEKTTNHYRYLRNKYILKNELRRPLGRKVAECFRRVQLYSALEADYYHSRLSDPPEYD